MKAYFISGLGADGRVFRHIRLPEIYEPVYLDWLAPLQGEGLADYAARMAERIDHREPFILIGLSMGGMIATEIARAHSPKSLILISSVPDSGHLPAYVKLGRYIPVQKVLPIRFLKTASFVKRFFTNETGEDKKLISRIIRESDPDFIRWAMNAIVHWNADRYPDKYYHIHGSRDFIIPHKNAKPTHTIKGGGHMMIMENAREINEILKALLETIG